MTRAQEPSGSSSPPLGLDHRSRLGRRKHHIPVVELGLFPEFSHRKPLSSHVGIAGRKITPPPVLEHQAFTENSASRREPSLRQPNVSSNWLGQLSRNSGVD